MGGITLPVQLNNISDLVPANLSLAMVEARPVVVNTKVKLLYCMQLTGLQVGRRGEVEQNENLTLQLRERGHALH